MLAWAFAPANAFVDVCRNDLVINADQVEQIVAPW
jgi:hypothetical protein